ncbi:hypothetical protein MXD62_35220 [Frankia sp. Mgl5]|uniref:hypothetical protein n=1 Tax=Frankia sp. Mgl5 TaxID=2933793 RepID=UPI00200E33C9|nr:hypothetical protein [Frankia sp. Mgl5]MCK9932335.1 hypothetical protein [Frankia sp. Mgl5]
MADNRWGYRPRDSAVVVLCNSEQAARKHAVDGATAVVHRDGQWVGLPTDPRETPDRG